MFSEWRPTVSDCFMTHMCWMSNLIDLSLSHAPLSYCCYVRQAFGACMELTLSLTAHPGELLFNLGKNKEVISDRGRQKICDMNLNDIQA